MIGFANSDTENKYMMGKHFSDWLLEVVEVCIEIKKHWFFLNNILLIVIIIMILNYNYYQGLRPIYTRAV